MKNGSVCIFNLLFFVSVAFLSCKEQNIPPYIEIPFVVENKRVIIEAVVNRKKGRFIFDTGTTESYLDIPVWNLSREGIVITPYKGKQVTVPYYNLKKITVANVELRTRSWVINRSDLIAKSKNDGCDGILGAGVFEGFWCELSFSKRKIILHKEKPDYFTRFSPVKILNKYNADFFIPVVIDGHVYYFDIDTGSPMSFYFPGGLVKRKSSEQYREIAAFEENGMELFHLVQASSIEILEATYTGRFVMTNSQYSIRDDEMYHDLGLLGIDFLRYYDFLFDYRELREGKSTGMYYEPNTPVENRDYGIYSFIKKAPEFGILNYTGFNELGFLVYWVLKDSIAYHTFGLRPGMTITKIDGKPINEIPREKLFEPYLYLTVDNYTILEDNVERTISSPLGSGAHAIPTSNRGE